LQISNRDGDKEEKLRTAALRVHWNLFGVIDLVICQALHFIIFLFSLQLLSLIIPWSF